MAQYTADKLHYDTVLYPQYRAEKNAWLAHRMMVLERFSGAETIRTLLATIGDVRRKHATCRQSARS
eukprot:1255963-Prymnesium_polylepis.1